MERRSTYPMDERHPLQAQSPYSATKIAADRLAESFHRSFELPVTIVRPFNTFGPRQSARAVIPTLITQLLNGAVEIRLGSITPTRDFNYVTDTVNGFVAIAESDRAAGEEINIASGRECSIGTLAQLLIERINPNARVVGDDDRVQAGRLGGRAPRRRQHQADGTDRVAIGLFVGAGPRADGRLVPGPCEPRQIQELALQRVIVDRIQP